MLRTHFPGGPVFEAVPEPGPLSPNYVPPEPEPEPEQWTGPTQEQWEQTQAMLAQTAESYETMQWLAQQAQQLQQQQMGQQGPVFDPFSEDANTQLRQIIREELAPYEQLRQDVILGEAEERASDILADLQARNGEFTQSQSADLARALANQFLAEEQTKHGFGPKAAEAALERGYNTVREYENTLAQTAIERHNNQLKTLNDAPREPGTGAPVMPAVQGGKPQFNSPQDVLAHYGGWGT